MIWVKMWRRLVSYILIAVLFMEPWAVIQAEAAESGAAEEIVTADPEETAPESIQEESVPETVQEETIQEETVQEDILPEEESGMENAGSAYRYVAFSKEDRGVEIRLGEVSDLMLVEDGETAAVYRVNSAEIQEIDFEAVVSAGFALKIPEAFQEILEIKADSFEDGFWVYRLSLATFGLSSPGQDPAEVYLQAVPRMVPVTVEGGNVKVEGVAEDETAPVGSVVSIEVTQPGYALARISVDEEGHDVYTVMPLDYDNTYEFVVEDETRFLVTDPEQAGAPLLSGPVSRAKIPGAMGIKLKSLTSSAQGYQEIVLNFTAVKNANDGTETEAVYYEVKVQAVGKEGQKLPAGAPEQPLYYYIPKTAGADTQSKSIRVNDGDLSASTACSYDFTVRMVQIDRDTEMPGQDTAVEEALETVLSGNSITKRFSTKNCYYEDKIGFNKKRSAIYSGQKNLLMGTVKYSKKASVLHDLSAAVYDSNGQICDDIRCVFKNDNDELYLSADKETVPGRYTVTIYAGIGEELDPESPQSGSMYRSNTSFTLTVQAGISYIDTKAITDQVAVYNKNISFSAVPVGYHGSGKKAKTQKFTYEIFSAERTASGEWKTVDPSEKVRENVSVNKSGKVTVKKGYYVDEDPDLNWIAVVVRAADYEGNEASNVKYVQVVDEVAVPSKIVLRTVRDGSDLGTTLTADKAQDAYVVVLDQNGKDMTSQVKLTPAYKANASLAVSVRQTENSSEARLQVNRPGTVTLKAAATNGSGKSKSVKITVKRPKISGAAYRILGVVSDGFDQGEVSTKDGYATYSAPKGAVFSIRMGARVGSAYFYNAGWFDWEYEITGGSLKKQGNDWLITPSQKNTTLKVWLSDDTSRYWTLKITNTGWNTQYDAAQKVKLIKGEVYTNAYNNESSLVYQGNKNEAPRQVLTYQYEYGSYDSVRVAGVSPNAPGCDVTAFDPEHRTFRLTFAPGGLKAGSYRYRVAFYKGGVLMGRPSPITVKVSRSTQVKVTASYTLNLAKQNEIEIKCSTRNFTPEFDLRLMNANVGGAANNFSRYFEMVRTVDEGTGKVKFRIRFKDSVTAGERAALKGKSMTGYVRYSYYLGSVSLKNVTAKITIKIK